MSKIDSALGRLDGALSRLEAAFDAIPSVDPVPAGETEAQQAEHARLEEEVQALRARAEDDAKLRAEAASAVRAALSDLRGAVTRQIEKGTPDKGATANA